MDRPVKPGDDNGASLSDDRESVFGIMPGKHVWGHAAKTPIGAPFRI
jgi:hypothetical protein